MATTYYASNRYEAATGASKYTTAAQYAADYLGRPAVAEPLGYDITCPFFFDTTVLTTPHLFVVNDVLRLVKIPKGAVITDYSLFMPAVDNGATCTHHLGLLNAGTSVFAASGLFGRAAQVSTVTPQITIVTTVVSAPATTVVGVLPYPEINTAVATQADGGDVLVLTAAIAGGAAGAGGVIHGWVRYIIRPFYFDSIKNAS